MSKWLYVEIYSLNDNVPITLDYRTFSIPVLRAVRILRSVSFIRGLQVLVTALVATFLNAMVPLLFLLFILMFIFSVVGYYWFGFERTGDLENWGTFGRAMLSLFTYVTVRNISNIRTVEHLNMDTLKLVLSQCNSFTPKIRTPL